MRWEIPWIEREWPAFSREHRRRMNPAGWMDKFNSGNQIRALSAVTTLVTEGGH